MKLLQNPYVVGALALAAVALVASNLSPHLKRSGARPAPRAVPAAPAVSPATAPATVTLAASSSAPRNAGLWRADRLDSEALPDQPARALLVGEITRDLDHWVAAPVRDPFRVGRNREMRAAADVLTLGGILRQTGSTLAVINNRVMAVGDSILEYEIEQIGPERVWVRGDHGLEPIDFR